MFAFKNLLRLVFLPLLLQPSSLFLAKMALGQPPQPATSNSNAEKVAPPTGDYNRLIHPQVADELGLSDQQRAAIQSLLAERTEWMVSDEAGDETAENARSAKIDDLNQQIRNVLTDAQVEAWSNQTPSMKLRFQFREQPWGDVLQWFASQEGLTLVMNQVPPGTFTYTDTRSYSAAEAIDLLNSVLLTHGYTLVRREKMLTVFQLSNSIPIELVPRVQLEELPSRGRFELISVLFSLGNRPVDAVMKEVQPYLGSFGRAIPLPQSKQLLVIETAGKMDTINVLINTVPEPKAAEKPVGRKESPAPVFAAYALGDLDPQVVLETVKELVGSKRVAVDAKTRLLTAYVEPGQQTAIQSAIEKMRESLSVAPASVSVGYPLRSGDEKQIREQVTAIAPRAIVSVDKKASRVFITAPPADQQRIAEAFKAMGIASIDEQVAVKAFQVEPAQAPTISAALQNMIPSAQVVGNRSLGTLVVRGSDQEIALAEQVIDRWRGTGVESGSTLHAFKLPRTGTAAWLSTVAKIVPQAKIWLDADAKQLILLGTAEEKTRLETMLPQLLTALPSPPDRLLKTYSLTASELERWTQLQPVLAEKFPSIRPIIRKKGEDGSAEMLVWGTAENQAEVAEALEQVKQTTPETKLKWPKIYDFGKRDPALFSELLQTRFPGIRVTIDAASNRLTVWAEQETHGHVAELLAQVTDELPTVPDLILKTYRLEGRTPGELQKLLSPVLASIAATQSRGKFKPVGTMTIDDAARRLMIMATEEAHERIEEFVQELGKPTPPEQELILLAYRLEEAVAADVKTLIDRTVEGVTVVADDRRNQLVVTATLAQHGRIKTLISEMDRPGSKFASEEIRAYELLDLKANTILRTLQSMWPQMKLSADVPSNRIVASGNADDHESLKMSIERLNMAPSGEAMHVETYDVPMGDLRTLPTVLSQIAPQAVISSDTVNRAIVVWANDEQHTRIAAAIEQLSETAEGRREIEIFEVPPERAAIIRSVVISLFPTATVGADAATGQLTVLASSDIQLKISELLEKTKRASEAGSRLEPRLYEAFESIRTAFTSVLKTTVPRATVVTTGSNDPNKIMILASPDDHERVATLLTKLSEETGPAADVIVQAYELNESDPIAFSTMLSERHPNAKVLSGARTNRFVIATSKDDHAAIQETIEELENAFAKAGQQDLRVYQIRKDLTQQAVAGVKSVVPRARLMPSHDPERIVLLASPVEHAKYEKWLLQLQEQVPEPTETTSEVYPLDYGDPTGAVRVLQTLLPKVVFAADKLGKSIAATATEEDHETIKAFVQQYDDRQMDDAETKVFQLGDVNATSMSQAVMQMAPTARVTPDRVSNRLVVTAPKDILERVTRAIESMESDPSKRKTTKNYELEGSNANSLRAALQTSYPRATIAADNTSNSLIVSATDEEQEEIAKLVDSMNSGGRRVTRSYQLESGNAYAMRSAVLASFPKTSIGADSASNCLIVSGTEEEQTQIAELIQTINLDGLKTTKGYAIESGSAASMRSAVAASFPKATISADNVSNRLIASATVEDQTKIAAFVEDLNSGAKRTTESYVLENGDANAMRLTLQSTFPQASIGADRVNNCLIVSGTEEEHAQIAELIQSINSDGLKTTKGYAIESGSAASIRSAVAASFPKATISADNVGNRLIASATVEDQTKIAAFIEDLNSGAKRTTESYVLENGDANAMRLTLQSTFPQASIGADRVNNCLIVSGTEEEHAQIAELIQSINSDGLKTTKGYAIESGSAASIRSAVAASFPKATISADNVGNRLIASATVEDQTKIAAFVEDLNSGAKRTTESYVLENGDANAMRLTLQSTFPQASIGADRVNNCLIVSGTEEEHAQIAELIQSINSDGLKTTKGYAIESGSAASIRSAVAASFPKATISADNVGNRLIASATAEDQIKIAAFVEELNSGAKRTTESYVLENGDPNAMRLALQSTFPQASIGADRANNSLIVSATAEEHAEIATLVDQINSAPGRSEAMQAYSLAKASPQAVVAALQQAFGRGAGVGVSADEESGTVFVVGLPKQQEIAKQVIEQMDRVDPLTRDRRLKAFALSGIDGEEVADAVQSLFINARPEVEVRYDFYNDQLVVIGNAEQLQTVEETLAQFEPPDRELAIFPLQENDPNSVRDAVDALFADLPSKDTPTITIDEDRQQLLIRGTAQQMEEIRDLLGRLGETIQEPGMAASPRVPSNARVRTIVVGRDSKSLLEQLQKVWPSLRKNPLRVIRSENSDAPDIPPRRTDGVLNRGAGLDGQPNVTLVAEPASEDPPFSSEIEPPAVLILPRDGRWVIASEDSEALEMLTKLMEVAVSPPMMPVAESGNLSIYVLQHGNADDLESILENLFRQNRGSNSRFSSTSSETRIVADTRINALIVQGSRADRGVIEDLLAVLDSSEFVDALQLATPQLIPIRHTAAERVEELLRTVYSSQLSQGSKRPQISIPEGVSQEVASMLEQINAEASGPLLTLSVDEISNSIVMRAPPELSSEIRTFIEQVDRQADTNRTGRMRIIQLQQTNAGQIERALQLMRGQNDGGRGGRR
ncbi:Bacterial type II/III secretion system short domain protein [Novipirellula aureliae]|uniref:Bacterial type II/III secretion system short domain protein n=1 Tax=Novipirellula aureliae TaxID=2527966 RepID=A0A5C6EC49_9BACT|nr:secretin N-terminal domain-containing protein [Novipirellula aureliae]TWU46014.1 Bacterial type II/III secretion system short domain protein [Novipirellula aureliae]